MTNFRSILKDNLFSINENDLATINNLWTAAETRCSNPDYIYLELSILADAYEESSLREDNLILGLRELSRLKKQPYFYSGDYSRIPWVWYEGQSAQDCQYDCLSSRIIRLIRSSADYLSETHDGRDILYFKSFRKAITLAAYNVL